MSLSDKKCNGGCIEKNYYKEEDVKEFIKRILDAGHYEDCDGCMNLIDTIKEEAGDKLK